MSDSIKYCHFRFSNVDVTLATLLVGDNVYMAASRCSSEDNFSRAVGRKYASNRLLGRVAATPNDALTSTPYNLAMMVVHPKTFFVVCRQEDIKDVIALVKGLVRQCNRYTHRLRESRKNWAGILVRDLDLDNA